MANNCNNHLSFEGTEENVKRVLDMFKSLKEEQDKTGEGVLPKEVNPDEYRSRYFFDIYIGEGCVSFWSKWVAPKEELSIIAQKFNITITNEVEELGCLIFGRESYFPDGGVDEKYLDSDDFDLIEYNEDGEVVAFKGEPAKFNEIDLLEQLLFEKLN